MDAFYTSVEQLDDQGLKGKPVVVGGDSERGVIAAASYEARSFGIKSAMSSSLAKKKCVNLIFIKPRFYRYKEISEKVRSIFYKYTNLVEPLSLDEAFLDVTKNKLNLPYASKIALLIRKEIQTDVGLTASAGISINKFTAKVATEINKPNGQKTILPENVGPFLESLPIEKFFGIGKVTSKKMIKLGIMNGYDLKMKSLEFLKKNFGKQGASFFNIVRGIQNSPVNPNRIRKSIGAERTFSRNLSSIQYMLEKLNDISNELEKRIKRFNKRARTITLKIKYNDFSIQTRSKTVDRGFSNKSDFFPIIEQLINKNNIHKPVRLLGISVSNFENWPQNNDRINIQCSFDF